MKNAPFPALMLEPFRLWSAVAWKFGELMLASAQVIGYRSELMRSVGDPVDPHNVRELALMGQEKMAAGAESTQAMALDSMMLGQKLGLMAFGQMMTNMASLMSLSASRSANQTMARQSAYAHKTLRNSASATALISRSTARIAQKGMKPIHSRATANASRLGKKKPA